MFSGGIDKEKLTCGRLPFNGPRPFNSTWGLGEHCKPLPPACAGQGPGGS